MGNCINNSSTIHPDFISPIYTFSEASADISPLSTNMWENIDNSSIFQLFDVVISYSKTPSRNIGSWIYHDKIKQIDRNEMLFIVQFMNSGLSCIFFLKCDKSKLSHPSLNHFFDITSPIKNKNDAFILTPKMITSGCILRNTIKNIPVQSGNHLSQFYYDHKNYFEIDIDLNSNNRSNHIIDLFLSCSKNITFELKINIKDDFANLNIATCRLKNLEV